MSCRQRPLANRAAPIFGAVLVLAGSVAALSPAVPTARALDPTPVPSDAVEPSAAPEPTAAPDPIVAPDVTPTPAPDPTPPPVDPTPDPTPDLGPNSTPDALPSASPDPTVVPVPSADASVAPGEPTASDSPVPSIDPTPSPTAAPAPAELHVGRTWIDELDRSGAVLDSGVVNAAHTGTERFTVYRVSFQVWNAGGMPVTITPRLESGAGAAPLTWASVPPVNPAPGKPFYGASDKNLVFDPRIAELATSAFRGTAPADGLTAVTGLVSAGINPTAAIELPPYSWTEVAFHVRATVDARWSHAYALRVTDGGDPMPEAAQTVLIMRAKPPVELTFSSTEPAAASDLDYRLTASAAAYAIAALPADISVDSPHLSASLTADGCAGCHSTHLASDLRLTVAKYRLDPLLSVNEAYSGADFALCLSCHEEAPFADQSGSGSPLTNFPGHGYHLGNIDGNGTGGDSITVLGDGQGNAVCGECHYSLHALPTVERGNVRFSPNVEPYNGVRRFDIVTQSCTLTCHGKEHDSLTFEAH